MFLRNCPVSAEGWRCLVKKYYSVWSNSICSSSLSSPWAQGCGGNTFGSPSVVWGEKRAFGTIRSESCEHLGVPIPACLGSGIPRSLDLQMVQHLMQTARNVEFCQNFEADGRSWPLLKVWENQVGSSAMPPSRMPALPRGFQGLIYSVDMEACFLDFPVTSGTGVMFPVLWFAGSPFPRLPRSAWSLADGFEWNGFRQNCTSNGRKEPALCLFHRTFDGIRQAGRGTWRCPSCDPGHTLNLGTLESSILPRLSWPAGWWGCKGSAYWKGNSDLLDQPQNWLGNVPGNGNLPKTLVCPDVFLIEGLNPNSLTLFFNQTGFLDSLNEIKYHPSFLPEFVSVSPFVFGETYTSLASKLFFGLMEFEWVHFTWHVFVAVDKK